MQEISPDKKTAILNAALELFSEQGIHQTPVPQIAVRAGIGVGTIYRYFKNKEDLINSLYMDIHVRLIPFIRKDYSETAPVRANFLQYFSNFICYLVKHPAELSLMEQYENHPHSAGQSRTDYNVIFKRASEDGFLKKLPFEMLGSIIMGMLISISKFYIKNGVEESFGEYSIIAGTEAIWDAISK
ncbi:MAG: TetR/AcrR family transcriptional regulator [Brevinematales bacterium]|jgi:AcrR family transcriptional regulator